MTEFVNFLPYSGTILIEVDGRPLYGGGYSEQLAQAIQAVSSAVMNQVGEQNKPSEVQISFGLKALGTGALAISAGDTAANFRVMLKMGGSSPGISAPQGNSSGGQDQSNDMPEDDEDFLNEDEGEDDLENID